MAKYTRAQVFSFIENTNTSTPVQATLTDEPLRCTYWTEIDPVTGETTPASWCPDMPEYAERMGQEYAVATYANPNQSMIYYNMSTAMRTKFNSLSAGDRLTVKNKAWTNYYIKFLASPNVLPEAPTE